MRRMPCIHDSDRDQNGVWAWSDAAACGKIVCMIFFGAAVTLYYGGVAEVDT